MYEILSDVKLLQMPPAMQALLETGEKKLVECFVFFKRK